MELDTTYFENVFKTSCVLAWSEIIRDTRWPEQSVFSLDETQMLIV